MARTLRGLERTMVELGAVMGPDLIVGVVRGSLPARVLRRAAELLQRRHPALRARVTGDRLEAVANPGLAFDVVAGDWRIHAEAELSRPLRIEAGESFRVIWAVDAGAVILSAHHAVVDGISMQALLHELLTLCGDLLGGRVPEVEPGELTPAALDAMPGRWWEGLAGAAGALAAPWILAAEARAMATDGARTGPVRSVAAFAEGTPAGLDRLTAACRAHGVTVGGAAMAAVSFAVGRLRAERTGTLAPVRIEVEVDLRRRAGLPADRIGMYTGGVRTDAPENVDFWTLARALKAEVDGDIARGVPRLAHEVAERLRWEGSAGPGVWAACSNLGRWPYAERIGPLTLEAVYGMNGAVPGGPAVIVWVHCVGGRLLLNAVGSAPTVDARELGRVLADVGRLLDRPAAVPLSVWAPAVRAA